MKRLPFALCLFSAFFAAIAFAQEPEELNLKDCTILLTFSRVWKYSPLVEKENAVWIVAKDGGGLQAIDWHPSVQRNITVWSGTLPKNIVAQAHTHGDHLDPKPSDQDLKVARTLNMWVFTLTRKGIWRAAPDGRITQELGRGWYEQTQQQCGK